MFERFRNPARTKSIAATFIFGIICLVFVFFGITPRQTGVMDGGAAARVNDVVISLADYNQAVQRMESQYRARLEGLPDAQRTYFENSMKARALDDLIMAELIALAAKKEGIQVADAEVRDQILEFPAFQDKQHFSRELYDQVLEANRLQPSSFEEKIRKEILLNRLQQLFLGTLKTAAMETEQDQQAQNTKFNLSFVSFDKNLLIEKIPVSQLQIDEFMKVPANFDRIKKDYEDNTSKYAQAEQVNASHILIKTGAGGLADAEAQKKIEEIRSQVTAKNFSELAKKYSQDQGSAKNGGALGWFGRGRMVKEFEQAAFHLEKGKVSAPVKSDFGYHLILVADHKPASQSTIEQVKDAIARKLLAESQVDIFLKKLDKAIKGNQRTEIQQLIASVNLKFVLSGESSLSDESWPKLQDSRAVIDALLQNHVIEGFIPQLVQSRGQYYVVDVKSVQIKKPQNNTAPPNDFLAMRRSQEVFETWYKEEAKKATIVKNQQASAVASED